MLNKVKHLKILRFAQNDNKGYTNLTNRSPSKTGMASIKST